MFVGAPSVDGGTHRGWSTFVLAHSATKYVVDSWWRLQLVYFLGTISKVFECSRGLHHGQQKGQPHYHQAPQY